MRMKFRKRVGNAKSLMETLILCNSRFRVNQSPVQDLIDPHSPKKAAGKLGLLIRRRMLDRTTNFAGAESIASAARPCCKLLDVMAPIFQCF